MTATAFRKVWWPRRGVATIEPLEMSPPAPHEVVVETACSLFNAGSETAFLYGLPNTPSADKSAMPDDEPESGVRGGWESHGWRSGDDFFPRRPEAGSVAGVIIEVGSEVQRARVGDRVQLNPYPHASHALVAEAQLNHIPDGVSFEEALFIAPAQTALFGVQKAVIQLAESVVVVGLGQIGLCALQLARLNGARPVIGIDPVESRLQLARALGADHVINPRTTDVNDEIHRITGGRGANVVIDASGNPDVLLTDFRIAARFGRVVILGSPRGVTNNINFYTDVMWKNLFIMGAHVTGGAPDTAYYMVPWQFGVWTAEQQRALLMDLVAGGDLDFQTMAAATTRMNYSEVQEAYRIAFEEHDRALNVIMDWGSGH
jgi:L-iditol 2-dehydrogenase